MKLQTSVRHPERPHLGDRTLRTQSDHRRVERVSVQTPTPTPSRHKRARFPCKRQEQAASAGRPSGSKVGAPGQDMEAQRGVTGGGGHTRWPPHSWAASILLPACRPKPGRASPAAPARSEWPRPAPDARKDMVSRTAEGPPAGPVATPAVDMHSISSAHASSSFHPGHSQTDAERCPLPRAGSPVLTSRAQGRTAGKGPGWAAEAVQGCRGRPKEEVGAPGSQGPQLFGDPGGQRHRGSRVRCPGFPWVGSPPLSPSSHGT